MLVVATAFFIVHIITITIIALILFKIIFTDIVTDNILHTCLYGMYFADRCCIVYLKSMLRGISLAESVRVIKLESLRHLVTIQITIIAITLLWLSINLIRQGEHTVLILLRSTLVVDVTTDGIPRTVSVHQITITICFLVASLIPHHSVSLRFIIISTTIHTYGHGDEPQCIDLITSLQVAMLELSAIIRFRSGFQILLVSRIIIFAITI